MKGFLVLMLVGAASASAQAPRSGQRCQLRVLNVDRNASQRDVFNTGTNINYDAAGNVRLRCDKQPVFLGTDSMSAVSGDYVRLYGHAWYRDSSYRITADSIVYILRLEKIEARGHVNALDQTSGSTLVGPYVDYWRAVKGVNDSAKVIALLHPTVRYFARAAAGDTAQQRPYILTGRTLQGFGESQLHGGGGVTIDRDSLHGVGDSLAFDRGKTSLGHLLGDPATLRRSGPDSFVVFGKEIRLALEDDKLRELHAFLKARVKRGGSDVAGDTVALAFTNEKLELTLAWQRATGATLHSGGYDVRGDSLAVASPAEQLREVRVFGTGSIQNPRDTLALKPAPAPAKTPGDSAVAPDTTRNTIWGDTLLAHFGQVDSAGVIVTRLQGLQAFSQARSYFARTIVKNGKPTPSINYTRADTIVVVMKTGDSAGVSSVLAHGHVDGVQLETASMRPQSKDTTGGTANDSTTATTKGSAKNANKKAAKGSTRGPAPGIHP